MSSSHWRSFAARISKNTCRRASVCFITTLIYLLAAGLGQINITFGRYSYFHGSHPNLGSEIIAMSIVLAACVLSWLPLLVVTLPSLYAIHLMEGRAALIVALIAIGAKFVYDQWDNKKRLALLCVALVCAGAAAVLVSSKAAGVLNSIFKLNDKYRGFGSGFVGRDQLWSTAWHWFTASPIIGNGAGFFDRNGVEIHNFFLFGLSEFGLLSLIIYGMIFYLFYELYRTDKKWFVCFLGIPSSGCSTTVSSISILIHSCFTSCFLPMPIERGWASPCRQSRRKPTRRRKQDKSGDCA